MSESTGASAVIRDGKIEISIDIDALPIIVNGSCCCDSMDGLWKVTDPAVFAKEVCRALNDEREDGTTRVHMMFDGAFMHAIDQGAEGIEEATEEEFEAEAGRAALTPALDAEGKQGLTSSIARVDMTQEGASDSQRKSEGALRAPIEFALGQLRHAYSHLIAGRVVDQTQLATGLIAPTIRRLECALNPAESSPSDLAAQPTTFANTRDEQENLDSGKVRR